MAKKKIHVHLGPHKTGSSAIQRALQDNAGILTTRFGLTPVMSPKIAKAAKLLNSDHLSDAAETLKDVAEICAGAPGDCIISCEDLAGILPGTRRVRRAYPHLWRNVSILNEVLGDYDCRFYFFVRQPDEWIRSAYVQNLKHRQKFNRLEAFADFLDVDELWDAVIAKPAQKLGKAFVAIEYPEGAKHTAMQSLMSAITGEELTGLSEPVVNAAPGADDIFLMEQINRSGASQEAKRLAKLSLLSPGGDPQKIEVPEPSGWGTVPDRPEGLPKALMPLWQRVQKRVHTQDQPNLMPDPDADLRPYRNRVVEAEGEMPDAGRGKMVSQAEILVYRFRNQPEICFLLGLAISYLRRDTPHTAQASTLFQRLWAEEHAILLGLLPTRWLISSFQTFLDHGINENQKIIGSGAYFYANILKAYETERALEGLAPDATYPHKLPQTKMGFPGLDRFKLGGSDLILNTNALLLEYSARDEVAGRVVQEFLARAKAAQSIFSRMDQSRKAHDINNKQFANCWSFFDEP